MRQILVIKNLLLSVREVYSQSAPGIANYGGKFIIKCARYYKLWQKFITEYVRYYKVWQIAITRQVLLSET